MITLFFLLLYLSSPGAGSEVYWNQPQSGRWDDPNLWTPHVPETGDSIHFPFGKTSYTIFLETPVSVCVSSIHLEHQAKVNITISNTNAEFGFITSDENDSALGIKIEKSIVKFLGDINASQLYAFSHDSEVTLSHCKTKQSTISLVNSKGFLTSVTSPDLKVTSDALSSLFVSDCNIGRLDSQSSVAFSGSQNTIETIQVNSTVEIDDSTLSVGTLIASNGTFLGTKDSPLKISTCMASILEVHVPALVDKVSESFITVYSDSEIALGDIHSSLIVHSEADVTLSSWNGQVENNGRLDIKNSNCKELINNKTLSVSSSLTVTTLSNRGNIFLKGSTLSSDDIGLMDGSMINCDEQSSISSYSIHGQGNIWSNCSTTATTLKGENCFFAFENTQVSFTFIEGAGLFLNHSHATICNSSDSSITLKESDISLCPSGIYISQTTVLLDHCNNIALSKFEALSSSVIVNNTQLRIDEKGSLVKSSLDVTNSYVTLFHTSYGSSDTSIRIQNTKVLLPDMSSLSFDKCGVVFQGTEFSGLGTLRLFSSSVTFDKTNVLDADIILDNSEVINSVLALHRAFTVDNSVIKNSIVSANDLHIPGSMNSVNSTIKAKVFEAFCNGQCQITTDDDSKLTNIGEGTFKGDWIISSMTNDGTIRFEKGTIVFNSFFSNGTILSDEASVYTFHDATFTELSVLSGGKALFMKNSNIQGKMESLNVGASHVGLTVKGALSLTNTHMDCQKSRLDLQEGVFIQGVFQFNGDADVTCDTGHMFQCNEGSVRFNDGVGNIFGECFGEKRACAIVLSKSTVTCDSSNNIKSLDMEDSDFSFYDKNTATSPTIKGVYTRGQSLVKNIIIGQLMVESGVLESLNGTVSNSITIETDGILRLVSSELDASCVTQGGGILQATSSTIGGKVFCDLITSKTVFLKNNTFVSKLVSNKTALIGEDGTTHVTFDTLLTSDISLNNVNISVEKTASLSSFVNCTNTAIVFETNSTAVYSDATMTCVSGDCFLENNGYSQATGNTLFDGFHTSFIQPLCATGNLYLQSSFGSGQIALLNNSQLIMNIFESDGHISITGPGTLHCLECHLSGLISNTLVVLNSSHSVLTVDSTLTVDEDSTFLFESGILEGKDSSSVFVLNGTLNSTTSSNDDFCIFSTISLDSSGIIMWNNSQFLSQDSSLINRNILYFYQNENTQSSFPTTSNYGTVFIHTDCTINTIINNYGLVKTQGNNTILNVNQNSGRFCLNGTTSLTRGSFVGGLVEGNGSLHSESLLYFSGYSVLSPGTEGGFGILEVSFLRVSSRAVFEVGGYEKGTSYDYILSHGTCHVPSTIEVIFRSFIPKTGDEFVLIQCAGDVTGKPKTSFKGIDSTAVTLEIRNNRAIVVVTGCQKPPFNVSNCTECQPGFLLHENNITCSQCQPGSVSLTLNSLSCEMCPDDSFQPESGKSSCEKCPNGTTTEDHITCSPINKTMSLVEWSSSSKSPTVVTWVFPIIFFGILMLFLLFTRRHKKKEIVVTLKQEPDELDEHDEPLLITPPVFPDFTVCAILFPVHAHCFHLLFDLFFKNNRKKEKEEKKRRTLFAFHSCFHHFCQCSFNELIVMNK